jgi:hypothetical protein
MAAEPFDVDVDTIRRGEQRPGPDSEGADRQAGRVVHPVDFLDPEPLHQAVPHHLAAAAAPLLRRLENHHRRAGEIAGLGEIFGRAEQHGRVPVMAAGVHLAGRRGAVRQVGLLGDRQRVHVGAQSDHPSARPRLFAPADHADHAGAADAGHHVIAAERLQFLGDQARGAMHIELQFRVRVQVAPPSGDFLVHAGNAVGDGHRWAPSAGRPVLSHVGGFGPAKRRRDLSSQVQIIVLGDEDSC